MIFIFSKFNIVSFYVIDSIDKNIVGFIVEHVLTLSYFHG